jgi:hypothetical protein
MKAAVPDEAGSTPFLAVMPFAADHLTQSIFLAYANIQCYNIDKQPEWTGCLL